MLTSADQAATTGVIVDGQLGILTWVVLGFFGGGYACLAQAVGAHPKYYCPSFGDIIHYRIDSDTLELAQHQARQSAMKEGRAVHHM